MREKKGSQERPGRSLDNSNIYKERIEFNGGDIDGDDDNNDDDASDVGGKPQHR